MHYAITLAGTAGIDATSPPPDLVFREYLTRERIGRSSQNLVYVIFEQFYIFLKF